MDAEALRKLATELRNVPRICIGDPLEMVVWLARRAAKLDAIAARIGQETATAAE